MHKIALIALRQPKTTLPANGSDAWKAAWLALAEEQDWARRREVTRQPQTRPTKTAPCKAASVALFFGRPITSAAAGSYHASKLSMSVSS